MKTKHELMAELIEKADWLIENAIPDKPAEYLERLSEYTRLRAELAEVKERSAEEILSDYAVEIGVLWNKRHVNELCLVVPFTKALKAMHQFASQSPKMPTTEIETGYE